MKVPPCQKKQLEDIK